MRNQQISVDEEQFNPHRYTSLTYNLSYTECKEQRSTLKRCGRELTTVSNISLKKSRSHVNRELSEMLYLRALIKKFRIQRMVAKFCSNIKRNITNRRPVQVTLASNHNQQNGFIKWITITQGLTIPNTISVLLTAISTLLALILSVLYSLQLVFPQMDEQQEQNILEPLAFTIFLTEFVLKLISKHYKKGRLLVSIKDIALGYLKQSFYLDLLVVIIILFCMVQSSNSIQIRIIRLVLIIKLWQNFQKNDFFDMAMTTSIYKEQYFELVSVIVTNLCFAHIMSLCLNGMALINSEENWLIKHNLDMAPWHIKYIWGIYWGTITMLTVGFGDFVATNSTQALCLTFISMISCISLSYNINCVGNIINGIKAQKLEKKKNLKVLKKMVRENQIEQQLQNRLNNYIQEAFQIRRQFSIEEQQKLLDSIPRAMKRDYVKNMTEKVFRQIPFLSDLTEKGRSYLAQGVSRYITHPEQIVLKKGAQPDLLILHKGELGFCIKNQNSIQNGTSVQKLVADKDSKSKLVSLDFLKSKRLAYSIKSLSYSIIYSIEKDNLVKFLKQTKADYQTFCALRDRSAYNAGDYELYKCPNCPTEFHNKFACPKLHFIPLHMQVIFKYLHSLKVSKQDHRIRVNRTRLRFISVLAIVGTILKEISEAFQLEKKNKKTKSHRNRRSGVRTPDLNDFVVESSYIEPSAKSLINLDSSSSMSEDRLTKVIEQFIYSRGSSHNQEQYDMMYDWNYYFPEYNPSRLKDRKH